MKKRYIKPRLSSSIEMNNRSEKLVVSWYPRPSICQTDLWSGHGRGKLSTREVKFPAATNSGLTLSSANMKMVQVKLITSVC